LIEREKKRRKRKKGRQGTFLDSRKILEEARDRGKVWDLKGGKNGGGRYYRDHPRRGGERDPKVVDTHYVRPEQGGFKIAQQTLGQEIRGARGDERATGSLSRGVGTILK